MKYFSCAVIMLLSLKGFTQSAEDAIRKESALFSANYVKGDVEAMTRQYLDDALLMPPSRDAMVGKKLIFEFWSAASRPIMHRCESDKIIIEGNTAHDYGYFFTQGQKPGEQPGPVQSAKYYILWVKDADGKWKMKIDMWNSRSADWNK
ncbi:MAG: DUF4440 domain-containing protein [Cyclobacteriaceae bacterium]|nr:DUF4440 domain-containing protein [Cyclobacteriaceae bacterium]